MKSELFFMLNKDIFNSLKNKEFRNSLSEEEKQYIRDRFDSKLAPKACPVSLQRVVDGYKKMTDQELDVLFKTYEMGEYVTYDEELEYLVKRIGLKQKPNLVSYEFSATDLDSFYE